MPPCAHINVSVAALTLLMQGTEDDEALICSGTRTYALKVSFGNIESNGE
jgi:hypothetical protein